MIAATLAITMHALGNITLNPGSFLAWIIAGLLAGWLAGLVVRGRGFGCLGNIVLGLVGAFVGEFLLGLLPITISSGMPGFVETLIVAFLGALVLVALGRLIGGARRPRFTTPPPRGPYGQP